MRIAIIDDFQNVARDSADWSSLPPGCTLTFFHDHLADERALAERLGVSADVRLAGFTDNPMRYFARASLFALSSRWEGASNVLIEAMACGCPVVAVDCPTGVREQLAGGRMGPIVPQGDKEGLARAMARRLDGPRDAEELKRHVAQFDEARMLNAYLAIVGRA